MISLIDGVSLDGLYPHEDFLISWFLHRLGTGGSLILDDLKDILKRKSRALEFQRDYETFKSMVKRQGERQGFFMKNDLRAVGYMPDRPVSFGGRCRMLILLKAPMGL